MKSFAKKLAFGLITTFALLGSFHALAQSGPGGLGPLIDNLPKPGDNPFSGLPSGVTCSGSSCSAPARDPEQVLAKEREEDRKKCEAEVGGLGALANQAGGIQNIVNKGLTERFPATLEQVFSERIPAILQEKLPEFIPQALQRGLQDQLPGYVNSAIGDLFRAGMSQDQIAEFLPGIINQGVGQLAPQIIARELPSFLEGTFSRELPGEFSNQFRSQIPDIISQSSLPGDLSRLVEEMVSTAQEAGGNAASENERRWTSLRFTNPNLEVSDEERHLMERAALDGIIAETANGVAASDGLNQIADSLSPLIAQMINQQLAPALMQTFAGGFQEAGNSFGSAFDSSINGLFGQGFDLSGGLTGDLFNPIMKELEAPLTNWAVQGVRDFGTAFKYDIPLVRVDDLNNIGTNTVGEVKVTPEASSGFFGDSSGDLDLSELNSGLKGASGNAATNVASQAGNIGKASVFSQEGLSNLGNGMKGAFSSGIGGIVGGFAGQIPIVGGLLAGISEQMVTGVLNELLGFTTGGAGLPTYDLGTQSSINSGFRGANKIASEVQGNTATSNENEQQLQKTMDRIEKINIDTCTRTKTAARVLQNLEKEKFVLAPYARRASALATKQVWEAAVESTRTNRQTSPAASGVQNNPADPNAGGSSIANYEEVIEEGEKEGVALALNSLKQSGNPNAPAVLQTLSTLLNDDPFAYTLTTEEKARLDAPLDKNNTDLKWAAINRMWEPNNNERGLLARSQEVSNREKLAKAVAGDAQYRAGQGILDIRECEQWVADPFAPQANPLYAGYCAKWRTLTPGSVQKDTLDNTQERLLGFLDGRQVGDDFANQLIPPLIEETQNLADGVNTRTGAAPVGGDPCPSPDECPQTGWNPNQVQNNVLSRLSDYSINQARNLPDDSGLSGGPNFELPPLDLALFNQVFPPLDVVQFQVEAGNLLTWQVDNATRCVPGNTWVGTDYQAGSSLAAVGGEWGEINLNLPETHGTLSYALTCTNAMRQERRTIQTTLPATPNPSS